MGKGSVFVVIYSLVLLILFGVFSYLITTVNPPPIKSDALRTRKFESLSYEEGLYPNENVQSDDNVAYGLEKVDYDAIEVDKFSNLSNYKLYDIPKIIKIQEGNMDKYKTINNSSKKNNRRYEMTTTKSKLAKGFRRSVRDKPSVINSKLLSLLLNVKLFNGQPRVEIQVLDDKSEEKIKDDQHLDDKTNKINITGVVVKDNRNIRELRQDDTLLVQVVGNLTNLNGTCRSNISRNSICKDKNGLSEFVVEIVNSNETSVDHVLDLPNNSKTSVKITTKSDKLSEVKEKYGINVTSAIPSKLSYLKIPKVKP